VPRSGAPLGPANFGTRVLLQQLHKPCRRFGHTLKGEFTTEAGSPNNAVPGGGKGLSRGTAMGNLRLRNRLYKQSTAFVNGVRVWEGKRGMYPAGKDAA